MSSEEEKKSKKKPGLQFEKNFQFFKTKFAKKHTEIKELLRNYSKMEEMGSGDLEQQRLSHSSSSQQQTISKFNSYSDEIQLEIDEVSCAKL